MAIRIDGTNTTANPGITGADADTGLQFGTDEVQFVTGGTNRATVESNGNLTIEDGNLVVASGHGIDFSATVNASGSTQELLDDYEEGTWTPTIEGDTTAGTYTYDGGNVGHYTKIGNKVFCRASLFNIATTTAGSGNLKIVGLPYQNLGHYTVGNVYLANFNVADTSVNLSSRIEPNASYLVVAETRDNASASVVAITDKTSDSADILVSICYLTAS